MLALVIIYYKQILQQTFIQTYKHQHPLITNVWAYMSQYEMPSVVLETSRALWHDE